MTRLLQYTDLEKVHDDPEQFGRLVGCIEARRGSDAVVVGTGDDVLPNVVSTAAGIEAPLENLTVLDPDFETFGNHDFDVGVDGARRIARDGPAQFLSANLGGEVEPFASGVGVERWTIEQVDGTAVGLFGVTTANLQGTSTGASAVGVSDPVAAAAEAERELRAAGAEVVVCLSHRLDDADIARETGVDVVCG